MSPKKLKNINTVEKLAALNKHIDNKNNHAFVLVHMDNCGPCMATRPEWDKLASSKLNASSKPTNDDAENTENQNGNVVIADVNSALLNDPKNAIRHVGPVSAFPTMKHIHRGKATDYSGADRSHASLKKWVQDSVPLHKERLTKHNANQGGGGKRKTRKRTIKRKKTKKRRTNKKRKRI
jgi:hypothetical protein